MSGKLDFTRLPTVKDLALVKSKQEREIPLYEELYKVAIKIQWLLSEKKFCMKENMEHFKKITRKKNPDGDGFPNYLISKIDSLGTFIFNIAVKIVLIIGWNPIEHISTSVDSISSVDSKSRKRKPKPTYEEKLKELPRKLDERKMNTDESLEDFEQHLTDVKKEFDAFYHETIDEMYEKVMKWYKAKCERIN